MINNSTWPMVSVVIPHYGGTEIISECLNSLQNCNYPNLEIIVVDNSSPDTSAKFIKDNYSGVKLFRSEYNRGFAGGCNFGAQHAQGIYLLILNNDTTHEPNWINYLVKFMESSASISSIQPKIRNYYKREKFDYSGACGGFIDKYCFPFTRGRIFSTVEKDIGQYDTACKIFWASGTAFLTKKKIFKEIGGFDETLFAHMEEIDYHWKCQLMGYEVWVEPSSVIYHKGAITLPATSPQKTYLNYRNSLILLLSNYSKGLTLNLFFPRFSLEFISFLKEILTFKWLHAFAIIRSWCWILGHRTIINKRRHSIKNYNRSIPELIYNKSIVKKYFLDGKKYYTQIVEK